MMAVREVARKHKFMLLILMQPLDDDPPKIEIEIDPNMHLVRILDKLCMKTKKPALVYEYTETELAFNVRVGLEKHRATGEGRNKKTGKKECYCFRSFLIMADNISKVYEAAVKRKLNLEFLVERADVLST